MPTATSVTLISSDADSLDVLPLFASLSAATRGKLIAAGTVRRYPAYAIMRDDPAVALLFLRRLSSRVRELVDRLDRATRHSVPSRLAAFLLERDAAAPGKPFTLGMTQGALAEELGTVREVVVRALARLRVSGAIEAVGRGRFRVRDSAALDAIRRATHHA